MTVPVHGGGAGVDVERGEHAMVVIDGFDADDGHKGATSSRTYPDITAGGDADTDSVTQRRAAQPDEEQGVDDVNGLIDESTVKIADDRLRCFFALLLLVLAGVLNDVVLAVIHERMPPYAPLPDMFFDHVPVPHWAPALIMSEVAMMVNMVVAFTVILLNRHRWTCLKRLMIVSALLYGGRALSMLVTQLPKADPHYYCMPKANETSALLILERAASLVSGLGMSIGGKHVLCGDYIYSGHTLVLVHSYLCIKYYTPRNWHVLHWASCLLSTFGVACLLVSRAHYTVDVLIAYWLTTRLFSTYHTMCAHESLRRSSRANHLSTYIWFPLFVFMERDIPCELHMQFDWPFARPRRLQRVMSEHRFE